MGTSLKCAGGGEADDLRQRPGCGSYRMVHESLVKRTDTCDQRSNSCTYQPIW